MAKYRWRLIGATLILLVTMPGLWADAQAETSGQALSLDPIVEDTRWTAEVLDHPSPVATPIAAWAVDEPESVDNQNALVGGGGVTCLQGGASVAVDFGELVGGYVTIDLAGADPNTAVVVGYAESRTFLGRNGDYTPELYNITRTDTARTDTVLTSGGRQSWRSPAVRGGVRYALISLTSPIPLLAVPRACISAIRVDIAHHRPSPSDYAGHFLSSDPLLNRIWYSGVHTYNLDTIAGCCGQRVVVDGAKRDRQLWAGDLSTAGATGAASTAAGLQAWRNSLEAFSCYTYPGGYIAASAAASSACQGQPFPLALPGPDYLVYAVFPVIGAYQALYVSSAYGYWLRSGDTDFVRRALPRLQGAMDWMRLHLRGGLYHPTPNEWRWTATFAGGADTFTNAAWVDALHKLARMQREVAGDEARSADSEALAAAIANAIRAKLYDGSVGAFRLDDTSSDHSHDANAMAVAAGVATGAEAEGALRFLREHLWTDHGARTNETGGYISPFIAGYELLGRLRLGDTTDALDLMRRTWAPQILGDPGGTVWERMTLDAGPSDGQMSAAHAWSSAPTWLLSEFIAGTQPLEPGYRTWMVAPQLGDLQWAQNVTPTPTGPLSVRWQRDLNDSSFRLTVVAPPTTSGTVVVPMPVEAQLWCDGHLVWDGHRAASEYDVRAVSGGVAIAGVSGNHTFAWSLT